MSVNYELCEEIIQSWDEAIFDGYPKNEAIDLLSEQFHGRHMNVPDVQYLYQNHPDARFFECGIVTHISCTN